MSKTGKLVVITGPSGVGKGTIVKSLLQRHPELFLSVSATTRSPRQGEIQGFDYYFLSVEEFKGMIEQSQLLEWAEYAGNYYGTPKQPVIDQIQAGKTIILEIEVLGARQVFQSFPSAVKIFIAPPSVEELENRLRGRGNDAEDAIIKRLAKAKEEMVVSAEFDYQIVNDNLTKAVVEIEAIVIEG